MTNEEILQTITMIMREVLEIPGLTVTLETSAADVDEGDSMTHIQLIAASESKYKVRFAFVKDNVELSRLDI